MSRLPNPGQDTGSWGDILNDYLSQSLKPDGSLRTSSLTGAGAITSVNNVQPDNAGNVSLLAADLSAYVKPPGGIPASDLAGGIQTSLFDANTQASLAKATNSVQSVNSRTPDATGSVILTTDDISDTAAANKFVTSADITKLSNISGINSGDQTSVTGNAGTATKLATTRNINGVAFDGTADITVADSTKLPNTYLDTDGTLAANSDTKIASQKATKSYADSIALNTQTASYTLTLADAGKIIEMNVASANTLTVPPNASVAFPVGTIIEVSQLGAGATTITAGAGVTINSLAGKLNTAGQFAGVSLRKRATDTWQLVGALA